MKILKLAMQGLPHFSDVLEIEFAARQRVDDDDKEKLYNVFSNIYLNKTLSFVGINASGKTTILKAVSFVLKMLANDSINNIGAREILNDLADGQKVVIEAYFYSGNFINKLETVIEKQINSVDGSGKFVITDEKLWSKECGKVKTKKTLFDFKDSDLKVRRNQNEQYLLDDVSIMVAENKKNNSQFFVRDMLEWTDRNILNVLGDFPKQLLTFLDPGIEYLKCNIIDKRVDIRLKFFRGEELVINNPAELRNYLSSGTIKGLSVFMSAMFAFLAGGYLIIDEIENHFNREIVATLIQFFLNPGVNKNGATLIFSTHYSELLDEFDRNDSIYIVRNRGGIMTENLSNILKRNDMKKSEVYDSGFLEGTVPSYESYMELKKVLIANVE